VFKIRKTAVGLDISDHTIEVVEVRKTSQRAEVLAMGALTLPSGIVEHGRVVDPARLKKGLKKLFAGTKPKNIRGKYVICGLPESQVYAHVLRLRAKKKRDIEKALPKVMQEKIPLPLEDILFSYKVVKKTADASHVLVVATSKHVAQEWKNFFEEVGLIVEGFDIESLALFRDLYKAPPKFPICVVDIGSATTHVSIFHKDGLLFSRIIHIAGDTFLEALGAAEGIDEVQAKKLLHAHGLNQKSEKGRKVLVKEVTNLFRDIHETLVLFEKKHRTTVTELALVGGTAQLKGLVDYVNKKMKKPTRLGTSVLAGKKLSTRYIEAVGLAWRGVNKKWNTIDPCISFENPFPLVVLKKTKKKRKKAEGSAPADTQGGEVQGQSSNTKKIILLVCILVFGGAAVFGAFAFRKDSREKRQESPKPAHIVVPVEESESFEQDPGNESEDEVGDGDGDDTSDTKEEVVATTTPDAVKTSTTVRVLDTGIGTLNVRSEPGIGSPVLTTVDVGQEFVLIEESEGGSWAHIQVDDEVSGWVSAQYVEEVSPVDN